MEDQMRELVLREVESALREVARARKQKWQLADGCSAESLLTKLDSDLRALARDLEAGRRPGPLRGIVRWVSDWIPDLDDPLLPAVGRVERALAATH